MGDAIGNQSPLSFGGFGSLAHHLKRLVGLDEGLSAEPRHGLLDSEALTTLNPYQPNLIACWMFQRAMSVPVGRDPNPGLVGTLFNSLSAMDTLGDVTMHPFLQVFILPPATRR